MWFQLLADAAEDTTENPGTPWGTYILLIVLVIALIGMFVWSTYSNKKRQKQMQEQLASIQPGYQIKTIGGICGTVVSIKDDKLVIETGADQVRIELAKWAMSTNETAAEAKKAEQKKAQEAKAKAKAEKKAKK